MGQPAAQVSGSPAPLCSAKGARLWRSLTRVPVQRGTLRGRAEGAGTGGCLEAAFGSQRGSFPGPDWEGRSWGAGERRPMQPGVPACSSAEQRERVLPALLHTHGKAWEKSHCLGGSTARLQEPAGCRGDPAGGNRGGKVLCEVQDPGARDSVHVVRTDTQGWPRGSLPPGRGCCPQRGRHGAGAPGGNECPCRGAPPSCWAAGADTCARVHLEGDAREDGAGHLSSPTPPGLGARRLAARGAQGVFSGILDRGSECGSTALSLTCGAAADARSAPPSWGRGGEAPTSGSSTQRNRAAETFCPLFPPELDSGGLRGRRREERKGGREERGLDRSATLLAAWPGWCSPGEHAHWGGV